MELLVINMYTCFGCTGQEERRKNTWLLATSDPILAGPFLLYCGELVWLETVKGPVDKEVDETVNSIG